MTAITTTTEAAVERKRPSRPIATEVLPLVIPITKAGNPRIKTVLDEAQKGQRARLATVTMVHGLIAEAELAMKELGIAKRDAAGVVYEGFSSDRPTRWSAKQFTVESTTAITIERAVSGLWYLRAVARTTRTDFSAGEILAMPDGRRFILHTELVLDRERAVREAEAAVRAVDRVRDAALRTLRVAEAARERGERWS